MMAETWASEIMTQALGTLQAFSSEFTLEWENSDMKAAIFKLLLGWIVLSVTAIQLAWKSYGATVNSIYYRQGENVAPRLYRPPETSSSLSSVMYGGAKRRNPGVPCSFPIMAPYNGVYSKLYSPVYDLLYTPYSNQCKKGQSA